MPSSFVRVPKIVKLTTFSTEGMAYIVYQAKRASPNIDWWIGQGKTGVALRLVMVMVSKFLEYNMVLQTLLRCVALGAS